MRFQYDQNENSGMGGGTSGGFGQFQSPGGQQQFSRMLSRGGGVPFGGFNRKPTDNIMPGPPQSYGPAGRTEGYTMPGPPQGPQGPQGIENTFKGDPFQVRPGGPGNSITRPPQTWGDASSQRNPWKGDPFQNRPGPGFGRPNDIIPPGDPRGGNLGFGLGPEIPNSFGTGPMTWAQQGAMGGPSGPPAVPNWESYGQNKGLGGGFNQFQLPQENPIYPIGPTGGEQPGLATAPGSFNWRF
jgi:hypothetical protein